MTKKKLKKYIGKNWFNERRPFEEFDEYEIFYWQLTNQVFIKLQYSISEKWKAYISKGDIKELAYMISGYCEDIINNIGIWKALENKHKELYRTPLPLIISKEENYSSNQINEEAIRFIIWNYFVFYLKIPFQIVGDIYSLIFFSTNIHQLLIGDVDNSPISNKWNDFFSIKDEEFLMVKEKLKWFAEDSYLFHISFSNYLKTNQTKNDDIIEIEETFIFKVPTFWSGLLALDIYSEIVITDNKIRKDIKNWSKKNVGFFKVLNITSSNIIFLNLINNKEYEIKKQDFVVINFSENAISLEGFQYFRNRWHLSGKMYFYGEVPSSDLEKMLHEFRMTLYKDIYLYDEKIRKIALESNINMREKFIKTFGSDFVLFKSGKEMHQKYKEYMKKIMAETPKNKLKKMKQLTGKETYDTFPTELSDENDVGIYFDDKIGMNILVDISAFISILQKSPKDISPFEKDFIVDYISADSIPSCLLLYLKKKYSFNILESTFGIKGLNNNENFLYFLRSFKPENFSLQFPYISIVDV